MLPLLQLLVAVFAIYSVIEFQEEVSLSMRRPFSLTQSQSAFLHSLFLTLIHLNPFRDHLSLYIPLRYNIFE
jgi:hypothetical protein